VFVNLQSSLIQSKTSPARERAADVHALASLSPNGSPQSPKSTSLDSNSTATKRKSLADMMSLLDHRIPRDEQREPTIVEETSLQSDANLFHDTHDHDASKSNSEEKKSADDEVDAVDVGADELEHVLSLDSSDEDSTDGHAFAKTRSTDNLLPVATKERFCPQRFRNGNKSKNLYAARKSFNGALPSSSASMSALLRTNHIRTHKHKLSSKRSSVVVGSNHSSDGALKNRNATQKKTAHRFTVNYSRSATLKRQTHGSSRSAKGRSSTKNGHGGHGGRERDRERNNGARVFDPSHVFLSKSNRVAINVGGLQFVTTSNTISADQSSMLSAMFSGRFKIERDETGAVFIDRDPTHFRHILNFLRDGIEYLKHGGLLQQPDAIVNELLQEAKFYNIRPLVDYIQLQQTRKNKKNGDELTHEKQYKLVTNIGIDEFEDVFNKFTGSAGYDFEEWLFVSPYKTSRSNSSAPTFTMLFSKKLSRAEVRLLDRLTSIDFQ